MSLPLETKLKQLETDLAISAPMDIAVANTQIYEAETKLAMAKYARERALKRYQELEDEIHAVKTDMKRTQAHAQEIQANG